MRHTEQFRHAEHPVEKEIGIVIIKEDFSRLPFEDFFVFLHDNSLQTLLYMISRLFQTTKIQIFSKQFTTSFQILVLFVLLFQTTKIQIFSKQFTTSFQILVLFVLLFQTTKIQIFESNSQRN
ncbi:hypothetical protein HMPREF0156_01405 [Bacteroidetes oral taxon 274 str. F0058]|nr:hypothetical protein HMPREF0156_01405 [Bacteroidetes oral taxon 274 str. F0058]